MQAYLIVTTDPKNILYLGTIIWVHSLCKKCPVTVTTMFRQKKLHMLHQFHFSDPGGKKKQAGISLQQVNQCIKFSQKYANGKQITISPCARTCNFLRTFPDAPEEKRPPRNTVKPTKISTLISVVSLAIQLSRPWL